jgi:transposase
MNLVGDRSFAYPYLGQVLMSKYRVRLIVKERGKMPQDNYVRGFSRAQRWQDGRRQRRCSRRWIVERFFAFLRNFRRLICRWEYYPENYLGLVRLACSLLLLNHF